MRRLAIIILVLFSMLGAIQVLAQEATAEPPVVVIAPDAMSALARPEAVSSPPSGASGSLQAAPSVIVIPPDALPDRRETLTVAGVVAIAVLVTLLGGVIVTVILVAWNRLPPWAQGLVLANRGWIEARVDEGTNRLVSVAGTTPNTFDDEIAGYINRVVDARVKAVFDQLERERASPPGRAPAG